MAEHISGSEDAFVAKMNEKAQVLGMKHTHFVNCCGLDADGHYTSARDIRLNVKRTDYESSRHFPLYNNLDGKYYTCNKTRGI